jgi:hypothetical protein
MLESRLPSIAGAHSTQKNRNKNRQVAIASNAHSGDNTQSPFDPTIEQEKEFAADWLNQW